MDREEALKIVRENYPHFGTTEPWLDLEKALATLIPELAESEDERIRKWIVKFVTEQYPECWKDKKNKMLAYLEKQKEQKPAIKLVFPKFRVGDIIRNVHDESDKTTRRISYVGDHGYNFDYRHLGDKAGGGSFGFCYEEHYELVEQKQAEWSEEDKNMLWNIISIVGESESIQADEMLDWLKSLHPSWKPSEEQMEALNALNCHGDISYVGQQNQLISLYQDLKKLM